MDMKKIIVAILTGAVIISTVAGVNAKANGNNNHYSDCDLSTATDCSKTIASGVEKAVVSTTQKLNYVDTNGDGICDNQGTNTQYTTGKNYVDANGDGVCDNQGTCQGNGCHSSERNMQRNCHRGNR